MVEINRQKMKILIVAREDVLRDGLQTLLVAALPLCEMDLVDNGTEAFDKVSRECFDLVLFYSGSLFDDQISAVREIKNARSKLSILIVVDELAQARTALDNGVDQVIMKGFTIDALAKTIKSLVA
jgi:DNA-binding NarL/FixJ family response regulator